MNIHKNAKLTPLGRERMVNLPAAGRDDVGGLVSLAEPQTHARKGRRRCWGVPRHGQEMSGAFACMDASGRAASGTGRRGGRAAS